MTQQRVFELIAEAANPNCDMLRRNAILAEVCPSFNKSGGTILPTGEQMQLLAGTILLDTFCHAVGNGPSFHKDILGLFPLVVAGICDKSEMKWLATVDWETHKKLNP